jgi:hypothetical protein
MQDEVECPIFPEMSTCQSLFLYHVQTFIMKLKIAH